MPSREQLGAWIARLQLVLIVGAALYGLGFQLWLPTTHVRQEDYEAVGRIFAAEARPGDVVLLHPWWTERARLFVPPTLPVVGHWDASRSDLTPHPRVWVLSQQRLPHADPAGFARDFAPERTGLGPPRRFGNLTLTLYENGRHRPLLYSASESLERGRVFLEQADAAEAECPFDGRAHRCPGGPRVAREWHEVKEAPHRCVFMQAPGGKRRLVLELPGAPAADTLVLSAGLISEYGSWHDPRLSVTTVALEGADGTRLADIAIPPGLQGMQRVNVPPGATSGPLRLSVQADNPEARWLCVELVALGAKARAEGVR